MAGNIYEKNSPQTDSDLQSAIIRELEQTQGPTTDEEKFQLENKMI